MVDKNKFSGDISVELQLDNAMNKEMKIMALFEQLVQEDKFELAQELAHYCIDKNITPYLTWCSLDWLFLYTYEQFLELNDDNDPDQEERNDYWEEIIDYLWELKAVLPRIPENLHPAQVIDEFMDKMKLYYETWQLSLKMYYKTYTLVQMAMGNREKAKEYYRLWQETEDDFMSDCEACELAEQVRYFSFQGQHHQALELAAPLLDKEITCAEVPAIVYSAIFQSLLALERYSEVEDLLDEALEEIENLEDKQTKYGEIANILLVLADLGDRGRMDTIAQNYWDKIVMEGTNVSILKMHIAACNNGEDYYQVALEAAKDYDERNKNHYFQELLHRIKEG